VSPSDPRPDMAAQIPHLRRYARALRRDPEAADDLVQDCLERALSRLHLFRPDSNLKTWLFTILHNLHVNDARRRGRRPDDIPMSESIEARAATHGGPGETLKIRDLGRALDQLAEDQREVLLLVGLEGLSYKAAAEVLGVPVGTVMSRLSRGRDRLRGLMEGGDTPALRRVK